jgi:TrmH family RNA methyltransferase
VSRLTSRENPRLRRWHALARDSRIRHAEGSALIEGPHLLAACLEAGGRPRAVIASESGRDKPEIAGLISRSGVAPVIVPDALLRWICDVASPAGVAAEILLPASGDAIARASHAVFLDGVQDAGNVGAILRSAAAFGVDTAVLGPGCADPWSPKVLRAAMGGHFVLRLAEPPALAAALAQFSGNLVCAVAADGVPPASLDLTGRIGWIFGAEGRGVSAPVAAFAAARATVPVSRGVESLNVAAAAAVLLYERARQLSTRAARS